MFCHMECEMKKPGDTRKRKHGGKSVWHTHQDRIKRDAERLNIRAVFKHQKHLRGFNVSIKAALVW